MTIAVGDKIPEVQFFIMTDDGPGSLTTSELFDGKTVAFFAVPGAFTPTCHAKHVPGFITHAAELKSKGVDTIACVSVNDVFVMDQWAKDTGGSDTISFLADGSATFTKAVGMDLDLTERGLGIRSKRYAMLVKDGTVAALNIEDAPSSAEKSSAAELLKAL